MEKKQYDLFIEIIRRFEKAGLLDSLILIGSWSAYFYRDILDGFHFSLKTRDADFLVKVPLKISRKVDVPALLEDLGFIVNRKGDEGYVQLIHPDLIIEFLVPEKEAGSAAPYDLPEMGLNASSLRFLGMLADRTVKMTIEGVGLTLPHPINYAFNKLLVCQRRKGFEEKSARDLDVAIDILTAIIRRGKAELVKHYYNSLPAKWKNRIYSTVETVGPKEIIGLFR